MNKRQCVSCGAPINVGATKCDYCGMTYDPDYWAGTLIYVPIHTGRKRLAARAMVHDEILRGQEPLVADRMRHALAQKLADGLTEMMTIRINNDPISQVTIVEGEIWVEEADRRIAFADL